MNIFNKSLIVIAMVLLPTLMVAQERELSLREKLNSLTYTPAVKELARDRRRGIFSGYIFGTKE